MSTFFLAKNFFGKNRKSPPNEVYIGGRFMPSILLGLAILINPSLLIL